MSRSSPIISQYATECILLLLQLDASVVIAIKLAQKSHLIELRHIVLSYDSTIQETYGRATVISDSELVNVRTLESTNGYWILQTIFFPGDLGWLQTLLPQGGFSATMIP